MLIERYQITKKFKHDIPEGVKKSLLILENMTSIESEEEHFDGTIIDGKWK